MDIASTGGVFEPAPPGATHRALTARLAGGAATLRVAAPFGIVQLQS